jgi:hypothetical protein
MGPAPFGMLHSAAQPGRMQAWWYYPYWHYTTAHAILAPGLSVIGPHHVSHALYGAAVHTDARVR